MTGEYVTVMVWFTDPSLEHVAEETGDEVVLMKDRSGRVIGFEKLNFSVPESDSVHVALEPATTSKILETLRTKRAVFGRDGPTIG